MIPAKKWLDLLGHIKTYYSHVPNLEGLRVLSEISMRSESSDELLIR
jgi:hypothetical protein